MVYKCELYKFVEISKWRYKLQKVFSVYKRKLSGRHCYGVSNELTNSRSLTDYLGYNEREAFLFLSIFLKS